MRRNFKVALALLALLVSLASGAQAQYVSLIAMRQVNAQHNDQNRFIDVVHHFYTSNWSEANTNNRWNEANIYNRFYNYYFTGTVAIGWTDDTVDAEGGWGTRAGLKRLYRLFRASTGAYYYTSDYNEFR